MESLATYIFSFFLLTVFPAFISFITTNQKASKEQKKPNILIMLADDMGYAEIGSYGGISHTPNLDKLARQGVRFTDFYAGAPNCSPSRSALLTGRSPAKIGMYNYRPPSHPMHLRSSEITLAKVLKEQGYQTSIFGKWHLGCLPQDKNLNQPQPDDHGFDFYFVTENNAEPSHFNPENYVRNGLKLGKLKGYSCQLVADEAISWMEKEYINNNPFFMYVAFHEPHASTQWTAPPELVKNYNQYPEREANCFANVQNLDSAAGRILKYLDDRKMLENTLVIFSSDNGSYRQKANGDFKGVKSYLYEGGIRIPAIFRWPHLKSNPGTVVSTPAGLVDITPTVHDILDIRPGENIHFDGTSILNLLNSKSFERRQPLFWFFYRTSPEIAIRKGDYMILGKDEDKVPRTHEFSAPDMTYIKNMTIKNYELYNLVKDKSQSNNLFEISSESESYKKLVNEKMQEIQAEGYYWEHLPLLENKPKRLKTDWVKLN